MTDDIEESYDPYLCGECWSDNDTDDIFGYWVQCSNFDSDTAMCGPCFGWYHIQCLTVYSLNLWEDEEWERQYEKIKDAEVLCISCRRGEPLRMPKEVSVNEIVRQLSLCPHLDLYQARDWIYNWRQISHYLFRPRVPIGTAAGNALPSYKATVTYRIKDNAMLWCRAPGEDDTFHPIALVLQDDDGATEEDNHRMSMFLRKWMRIPKPYGPATIGMNARVTTYRPAHSRGSQHIDMGGIIQSRAATMALTAPVAMGARAFIYEQFISQYKQTTAMYKTGLLRYLMDPQDYGIVRKYMEDLPEEYQKVVAPVDGNTTHVLNFDICVDDHRDGKNHGWVTQVNYGNFPPTGLEYPDLGVMIMTKPRTLIIHQAQKIAHRVEDYKQMEENGRIIETHRFTHTAHIQESVFRNINGSVNVSEFLEGLSNMNIPVEEWEASWKRFSRGSASTNTDTNIETEEESSLMEPIEVHQSGEEGMDID